MTEREALELRASHTELLDEAQTIRNDGAPDADRLVEVYGVLKNIETDTNRIRDLLYVAASTGNEGELLDKALKDAARITEYLEKLERLPEKIDGITVARFTMEELTLLIERARGARTSV